MLEALLDQLRRTQAGNPWYGSPRSKFVAGLTAAEAASHPVPGAHSIWELVLHMTAWTNEVRRRMAGREPAEPLEGDWPAAGEPTESAWSEALASLDRAHAALVDAAAHLSRAELDRRIGEVGVPSIGTGVTLEGTLVGLAQHDAYHTGQLAILRGAIEAGRR